MKFVAVLRGPGPLEKVIFLEEASFRTYLKDTEGGDQREASGGGGAHKKKKAAAKGKPAGVEEKNARKRKRRATGKSSESEGFEYGLFDRIQDAVAYLVSGGTSTTSTSSSSSPLKTFRGSRRPTSDAPPPSDATARRSSRETAGVSAARLDDEYRDPDEEAEFKRRRIEEAAALRFTRKAAEAERKAQLRREREKLERQEKEKMDKIWARVRAVPWSTMLERLALHRAERGTFEVDAERDDDATALRWWLERQRREYSVMKEGLLRGEMLRGVGDLTGERIRLLRDLGVPDFDGGGERETTPSGEVSSVPTNDSDRAADAPVSPEVEDSAAAARPVAATAALDSRSVDAAADPDEGRMGEDAGETASGDGGVVAAEDSRRSAMDDPGSYASPPTGEVKVQVTEDDDDDGNGDNDSYKKDNAENVEFEPERLAELEADLDDNDGQGDTNKKDGAEDVEVELEKHLAELEADIGVNDRQDGKNEDDKEKEWLVMYERFRRRNESHGDNALQDEDDDPALVTWVLRQQIRYRRKREGAVRSKDGDRSPRHHCLSGTRIRLLRDIGFDFGWVEGVSGSWEAMLEQLKAYQSEMGSYDVDGRADPKLFAWTKKQHRDFKKIAEGKWVTTPVMEARREALRAAGFPFRYASFEERLDQLKQFQLKFGHCDVPEKGHFMSSWFSQTRLRATAMDMGKPCRDGHKLTADQLGKLREVGFRTKRDIKNDREEVLFKSMLEELRKFKLKWGNCLVPNKTELGKWVSSQRTEYRALQAGKPSRMNFERMQTLLGLGFVFHLGKPKFTWEERMEAFRKYKAEHGDLLIPIDHPLRQFAGRLRMKYNRTMDGETVRNLTKSQIQECEEMGFVFQLGTRPKNKPSVMKSWDERFQEIVDFKQIYGHCVVPQHYQGHAGLGNWVNKVRTEYKHIREGREKKGRSLNAARVARLVDIGFTFDAMYRRGCKLGGDLVELDRSSGLAVERVPAPPLPPPRADAYHNNT